MEKTRKYVYVLTVSTVLEYEDLSESPRTFSDQGDARKALKENLREALAPESGWITGKWEVLDDRPDEYCACREGDYSRSHYHLIIWRTQIE